MVWLPQSFRTGSRHWRKWSRFHQYIWKFIRCSKFVPHVVFHNCVPVAKNNVFFIFISDFSQLEHLQRWDYCHVFPYLFFLRLLPQTEYKNLCICKPCCQWNICDYFIRNLLLFMLLCEMKQSKFIFCKIFYKHEKVFCMETKSVNFDLIVKYFHQWKFAKT